MKTNAGIGILTVVLLTAVQLTITAPAWGFIVTHSVLLRWMLQRYDQFGVPAAVHVHDFLVNIVLWMPFAVVLWMLKPQRIKTYTAVAIVSAILFVSMIVWVNTGSPLGLLSDSRYRYPIDSFMRILAQLLAVYIVGAIWFARHEVDRSSHG